MESESRRQRLIDALKHLTPEMKETLRQRKEEGLEQKDRPDFVWHSLLQSFATMGNARGWDGLIGNEENYNRVTFEALSALDRLENLDEVLRASKVRMPAKKAVWLDLDYEMIIEMGGPEAVVLHPRGADVYLNTEQQERRERAVTRADVGKVERVA